MENKEIWKDIPGYEGLYKVSNHGRVLSLPRGKQWPSRQTHNNIRKQRIKGHYYQVNLSKDGKATWLSVHRLVAMAFIENPLNFPCVNHKDENQLNNHADNLEWCTYQYNANYGTGTLRQIESRRRNPHLAEIRERVGEKNSRRVRQLTKDGVPIAEFGSLTEASESTGVHISTIIKHCRGRVGISTRKFKFEYIDSTL